MWALLEKWRGKSKDARSRIAFIIAGSITGVVAMVWIASLPARFAQTSEQAATAIEGLSNETANSNAGNTLQDLVTTAEALRGQVPVAAGTTTASTSEPTLAIPRRVLIATTTEAATTGEIRR